VPDGATVLVGLYNLERMADHATNIAENVIFLSEAKLVRHRAVNEDGVDVIKAIHERDHD
jgi:phosphate uptake regulator